MDDLSEAKQKAFVHFRPEPTIIVEKNAPQPRQEPLQQEIQDNASIFCGACLDNLTFGIFSADDKSII
jgi:hypothetical protein